MHIWGLNSTKKLVFQGYLYKNQAIQSPPPGHDVQIAGLPIGIHTKVLFVKESPLTVSATLSLWGDGVFSIVLIV